MNIEQNTKILIIWRLPKHDSITVIRVNIQ
jgi:hypothetical protein